MLNSAQQAAIYAPLGPLRIIAGPGTGKTRTLVQRIEGFITQHRLLPAHILALTFTNKAAHELTERLRANSHPGVASHTFHALAARLLRQYWQPDFRILTEEEQRALLQQLLTATEYKQEVEILADWEQLAERDFLQSEARAFRSKLPEARLRVLFKEYQEALQAAEALDFSQLQVRLLQLWRAQPAVLQQCQQLFQAVLVDEYQDVSSFQVELVCQLVKPHCNLTVVGDNDQTIYTWRGARATSLQEFKTLFPAARTVRLTHNYRNPPAVLRGAQALIAQNADPLRTTLLAVKKIVPKIQLWEVRSEAEEREVVLALLEQQVGSISQMHTADELDTAGTANRALSELAILYRTQAQGKQLEAALTQQGYPVQRSSGEHFWQRREVEAFLETLAKYRDQAALPTNQSLSTFLAEQIARATLPRRKRKRLQQLISWAVAFEDLPCAQALPQFLDEARLQQETDNLGAAGALNLLTLHAAKGLEFPVVCLIGLTEGLLPAKRQLADPASLAEERRLLYVGLTRAKEELHLVTGRSAGEPSRFLAEITEDCFTRRQLTAKKLGQVRRRAAKQAQQRLDF